VRLRVRDNGRGIPADVLPRIFEPFYTTKEPGKGTGLGLAVVFGIIGQHHGWIECTTSVGRGACFDVYVPRCGVAPAAGVVAPPPPVPRGGETILLADDDALLRSLGRAILRRYGYEVLLAEDGQQAVEVYRREQNHIGLVILDLTMPRLSGRDALRQLLQINPKVRVLLASGYSFEQGADAGTDGALGFITKPYGERDLAAKVRGALDALRPCGTLGGEPEVISRSGLGKAEAEALLDWLESNGFQGLEGCYEEGVGFTVRWRPRDDPPPGDPGRRKPCPWCGSTRRPFRERAMSRLSWVLLALGVLVWPLLVLGLLLRVDVWHCGGCRRVLERGGKATLGWWYGE
jgi:CheY-like chemotaxis protein